MGAGAIPAVGAVETNVVPPGEAVGGTGLEPMTPSLSSWRSQAHNPQGMGDSQVLTDLLGRLLGHEDVEGAADHDPIRLAADLLQEAKTAENPRVLALAALALLQRQFDGGRAGDEQRRGERGPG